MKEILIFAGYLGGFLIVFWMIVAFLERRLTIERRKREMISEEENGDALPVPVIMAGIKSYESCFIEEKKKIKRVIYQPKVETVSLWKIRGRVK